MKQFTIFVIDDDRSFSSLLLCLAVRDDFVHSIVGYELILTVFSDMGSLDEAMVYIENTKPSLVLLDYLLGPGGCVASLELLEKIILCCADSTDVNILTGMYEEDERLVLVKKALLPMNISVIQKPFGIQELIEVVRKSIQKRDHA